jgi:hypothetical protein
VLGNGDSRAIIYLLLAAGNELNSTQAQVKEKNAREFKTEAK